MTNNYYVYVVDLPDGVNEMVCPCLDGYTIYLNSRIDSQSQYEGFLHAIQHITNNDFEKDDIQSIEYDAHNKTPRIKRGGRENR